MRNKLNMRKKAQEEDINEDFGPAGKDRDGKSLFVGDLVEIISSAEIEDLVGVPGVLPDDDVKILEGEAGYISKVNLDGNICLDLDGGWEVTTSPWNVRKLKTSIVPGKEEEKEKLAMNPSTPPETLAELSKDKDDWVRARVAENTNTSPETLAELAKDEDDIVRKYVGLNHSTPLETLTELSKDEDDWVRYFVALNPSTPPETLAELAKDEVKMIRRNVTLNPSTPSVLQQKVLKVIEEPEETMEASPYAELLRKYTADEIFDIAAGRKTDVTEEEVVQAKEVITRGIVAGKLNMRKKAQMSYEVDPEKMFPTFEKEQATDTVTRWLQGEFSSDEIQNLIVEHKLRDYIYYTLIGMYSHLVDKNKLSKNVLKQLALEMTHKWEVEGSPLSISPDIKELTNIDPALQKLLNKYTEDEIYDIAAGKKDATEEEIEQAKDVITRGIVANRLSMRKKADSWEEEEEEELVEGRNKEFLKELGNIGRKKLGNRRRAMVTKDELRKLYKQEVKGIYDEELADAIITDFVYELEDIVGVSIEDVDEQDRETLDEERLVQLLQQAKTPQEKMIAIDQVIHTVHEGGTYGKYLIKELWAMSRGEDYGENYLEKEEAFFRELSNLKISRLSMRKTAQSTPETIQKAQAGDENAIAQVIEENIGLISQALINWGYTPKSDEFEDVMSDIKVEMLNRIIPQYDSSKGVFSTFLSTAVYNFLRRGTRKKEYEEKQKEVSLTEPVEEGITIEDTLADKTSEVVQMTLSSARENLQNWLNQKKPDLEEVILRMFDLKVEEYSHEQIAEALNQEEYTSKGRPFTRTMVNNYVNDWIKPALAQFFEAFKTAKLNMRKKADTTPLSYKKVMDLVMIVKDLQQMDQEILRAEEIENLEENLYNVFGNDTVFNTILKYAESSMNPPSILKDNIIKIIGNYLVTLDTSELGYSAKEILESLIKVCQDPSAPEHQIKKVPLKEVFKTKKEEEEFEEHEPEEKWKAEKEPLKVERELTEETMEASPYAELLRKYTEDEIFDIAAGKKEATEEEVEQAKEVITRGIVANRLSMKKTADEDEPDVPEPEVTKQELKNLYIQEAKGIYDEEAMDFIISDFIRVFEEWLIYGAWSLKYEYESEEDKKSRIYKYEVEQIEDEKKLLQILQRAKTPQEKMIAIDQVIHTAHLSGVYGSFLIKDIELEGDSFYDELSNLKISSLHMRKGINE